MTDRYPFSAIVGMDLAKISLLLHAVNPRLGGVLLSGHRGCAKTTLARAFGDLLGDAACCEVPLGASEDRLLGSVDVASVLERNTWAHLPGLLEQADGGLLYVDEINLLPDSLGDQLLDVAATGSYRLEREGMSRRIDSRFVLIGSMNPEEGQLRPQLADRFAHTVSIVTDLSAENRSRVIEQQLAFEADAAVFASSFADAQTGLRQRIGEAKARLDAVKLPPELLADIGHRSHELGLEGMRGGVAVAKTALVAAAWEGRERVESADMDLAWLLCLGHQPDGSPQAPEDSEPPAGDKGEAPRSFVSLQPRGAQQDSIAQSVDRSCDSGVDELAKSLREARSASLTRFASAVKDGGPVDWRATVMGWLRDGGRRRLWRFELRRNRQLWVFVDASRSSGANGFLGRSLSFLRSVLAQVGCASLRVHVVQLHSGKVDWLGRNLPVGSGLDDLLTESTSAAGESCLPEALAAVHRDVRRRSGGKGDTVLVFSDGICTVAAGESDQSSLSAMKQWLQRLARSGAGVTWIAPKPKRGFEHPVGRFGVGEYCIAESM